MKVSDIYYFQDDKTQKPIVLWECANKEECDNVLKSCDKRKTRQACFMSDGDYFVGETITDDMAKFLINNNHMTEGLHEGKLSDYIYFYTEQEAYGDSRYYFNRKDKKFYRDFMSIGD